MFKSVSPNVNFPALEKEILERWEKTGLVKKYLEKNKSAAKIFSFLDGPITANNPMGVHHAWGRTYKDLWQRFWNMRGFKQRFQNGFDCQGLWVEVEVEKELGFKNKKDIEKYGIDKFVEKCKERVYKFAQIQTEQSKRLGYFMDWDNSYFTMSEENNYAIWNFLKNINGRGWLYKGHDTVPWCPRCGTAISQHEMLTEDYKELIHDSVFIEYPIVGRKNEFLIAWTTTPWTLIANVALAIHPDYDYVIATGTEKGNKYYLLKESAKRLGLNVEKIIKGQEILGLNYVSPFDNLSQVKLSLARYEHKVIATNELILPIGKEEGTGIVHIATGAGSEDFQLGKKYNLPVIEVIDEEANYLDGLGEFSKKNGKKHPELIIDFLKKFEDGKYLFLTEKYTHRYPTCWRCKTELVWRVVDEWYIAMDKPSKLKVKSQKLKVQEKTYRELMVEVAKKINWLPKWGLERELDWLKNMHDWLISKKRYWGLALPIWECEKCGHFEVIGGKEELKGKAVEGFEKFEGQTPHRPFIDSVKIKCPKCDAVISRIPDVGNPWLDAGIVPFSTLPKEFFPADFITESFPGQFKNWFYSLIAMSTALKNTNPFKTILGFATLFGEDGRPMHKSWGNAIEFNEGADKIGVDVMRWMYAKQNPENNLLFGYHLADQTRRSFHLMLWNIYNFFISNANVDKFKVKSEKLKVANFLDQWVMSRLHQTIKIVTESLENYDAKIPAEALENFVSDLSLWYVRRSRERVGPAAQNQEDKNNCYQTLYEVLVTLSKILAPFIPFLAEEIYINLTNEESVHLCDWPELNSKFKIQNSKLLDEMNLVRKVCELGHAERKKMQIKVRQPLKKLKVKSKQSLRSHELEKLKVRNENEKRQLEKLILDELNIKEIVWVKGEGELEVELETKITSELLAEGEAREIVRKIQGERKKLGTRLDEKVDVILPSWPKEFENYIKTNALVSSLSVGETFSIKRL